MFVVGAFYEVGNPLTHVGYNANYPYVKITENDGRIYTFKVYDANLNEILNEVDTFYEDSNFAKNLRYASYLNKSLETDKEIKEWLK
jgi:hypothetical protein